MRDGVADAARPLPVQATAIAAPASSRGDGPIFQTDRQDIGDPKAWVDEIAYLAQETVKGVASVFSALDPGNWF